MENKKKYCSGCDSEQYIWKNFEGNKYCKNCWGKIQSKDPDHTVIPQVSAKKKKKDVEYLKLRTRFLLEKPNCEIRTPKCTMLSTDVHHTRAGQDRSVYYLIQSTWLSTCRVCHTWIHEHPKEARDLNYLK